MRTICFVIFVLSTAFGCATVQPNKDVESKPARNLQQDSTKVKKKYIKTHSRGYYLGYHNDLDDGYGEYRAYYTPICKPV